jgi:hypothetical protein
VAADACKLPGTWQSFTFPACPLQSGSLVAARRYPIIFPLF